MEVLIDGDILVYRIGWTTEDVEEGVANWRMDELANSILEETEAEKYRMFLTESEDKTAFRRQVYPEYKANRRGKPKPKHYKSLRDHLVSAWNAEVVSRIEADDALGIEQTPETVIASIDKDLLQIEGQHYNFVENEWKYIDEETGFRNFYTQMIVGDSTDNLKGVPGKGKAAAKKVLADCHLEEDFFAAVRDLYDNDEAMLLNGRCVWIWRKPDDDWEKHFHELLKETNVNEATT